MRHRLNTLSNTSSTSSQNPAAAPTDVRGESVTAPNSWQQDQTSEEISLPSDYISVDGMRIAEQSMTEPVCNVNISCCEALGRVFFHGHKDTRETQPSLVSVIHIRPLILTCGTSTYLMISMACNVKD